MTKGIVEVYLRLKEKSADKILSKLAKMKGVEDFEEITEAFEFPDSGGYY
jgi:hypothetical protein